MTQQSDTREHSRRGISLFGSWESRLQFRATSSTKRYLEFQSAGTARKKPFLRLKDRTLPAYDSEGERMRRLARAGCRGSAPK